MSDRNITDTDIEAIVEKLNDSRVHACRFSKITDEQMYETVKFAMAANKAMAEDRGLIRKTLIVMGLTGLGSVVVLGIGTWIVKYVKGAG